jgi:hypothetical protein
MKHLTVWTLGAGLTLSASLPARAAEGESSFTPTSFVMPVFSVMLSRGLTVNVPLYSCAAADAPHPPPSSGDAGPAAPIPGAPGNDDCLVDMADQSALDALFAAPADIPPGTYDSVVVGTCRESNAFAARVKGTVELEGQTYYTTSSASVLSTEQADQGYATINYAGCGMTVPLARPITVGADDAVTVSAFFTLQNLSWVLDNYSPGLGGCAPIAAAHAQNVCSGLPVLVGYVGEAAPSLDSYYITEDPSDLLASQAAGQILLLSSGGEPFSGFLRRVYSHDSVTPSVSYDVPLREITKNSSDASDAASDAAASDAGLDAGTLSTYDVIAIGDPKEDLTKYRVRYPRFVLGNHTGTFFTANGASQLPYRAVKR